MCECVCVSVCARAHARVSSVCVMGLLGQGPAIMMSAVFDLMRLYPNSTWNTFLNQRLDAFTTDGDVADKVRSRFIRCLAVSSTTRPDPRAGYPLIRCFTTNGCRGTPPWATTLASFPSPI